MQNDRYLQIGAAARRVGVTSQTIRNWQKKIGPEYFSESSTRRTGKQFTPDDIAQLQQIKSLLASGHTYAQIPDKLTPAPRVLDEDPEIFDELPPEPEENGSGEIAPSEFFAFMRDMLESQKEQTKQLISEKDSRIAELQQDKNRLLEELAQERKPWIRRVFGG